MLADSFHAELYDKLSKYFEMVDTFQPGTIRLQVAIIHGEKHVVGLSFISKVVPQARAANLLWSFATGKPAFTGLVDIEFKATDADTGELLWAGADRRVGGRSCLTRMFLIRGATYKTLSPTGPSLRPTGCVIIGGMRTAKSRRRRV